MNQRLKSQLRHLIVAAGLVAAALTQSGCANDGSDKIWIDIVPTKPVTINADFKLLDTANSTLDAPVYIDIAPPWFRFSYKLVNTNTDDPDDNTVTIIAINLTYTAFDMYGNQLTGTSTFSPSTIAGVSATNPPSYLAEAGPGDTITPGGAFVTGGTVAGDFYAYGLPLTASTSTTSPTTPSTFVPTYNIQATYVGWFGTDAAPKKRFQKTITFSTQ